MSALEQKVTIYFRFALFAPTLKLLLDQNPMLEGEACFLTALSALLNHRPTSFGRPMPFISQELVSTALDQLRNSPDHEPAFKAIEEFKEFVDGKRRFRSLERQAQYDQGYSFLLRCAARIVDDARREARAQARHCP
ncbi:MAG: hypothetical protein PHC53_04585 [Patescibacteria group bacterium]|nr:hypothetical protein [Patescibacteria group bacterium]